MRPAEPSERNYAIFCAVEFEYQSLRSVAEQYEISPTRVQQIVEQVRVWYQATTPEWVQKLDAATQPAVAARLFDERLAHLSRQAMEAWQASRGSQTIQRSQSGAPGVLTTMRSAYGQSSYLVAIARLAKMRFETTRRFTEWMEKRQPTAESQSANPCAREMASAPDEEVEPVALEPLTTETPTTYNLGLGPEPSAPLLCIDAPNPVRSRKERKQRQRALARALARGK